MSEWDEIRGLAQLRLADVLAALGIRERPRGGRIIMCSPVREDHHPSFSICTEGPRAGCFIDFAGYAQGDIFHLVAYLKGWSAGNDGKGHVEAKKWLADFLGYRRLSESERHALNERATVRAAQGRARAKARDASYRRGADKIWNESELFNGSTKAEVYLREIRALDPNDFPGDLRCHQRLKATEDGNYYPALIAKIRDKHGNWLQSIHRTYLQPNGLGKADLKEPKLGLAPFGHGAVWLTGNAPIGHIIGLTEGIEDGLTARLLYNIPVLAACGAKRMYKVEFPDQVRFVYIFADRDETGAGERNAENAERVFRLRRCVDGQLLRCKIMPPPSFKKDWNEYLQYSRDAAIRT